MSKTKATKLAISQGHEMAEWEREGNFFETSLCVKCGAELVLEGEASKQGKVQGEALECRCL